MSQQQWTDLQRYVIEEHFEDDPQDRGRLDPIEVRRRLRAGPRGRGRRLLRRWHDGNIVIAGLPLAAAVPCYGPVPANGSGLATTKTAVLAIYTEQDTRITSSRPTAAEQLKERGSPFAQRIELGVGHASHNDTNRPTHYGAAQAQDAWVATSEWFNKDLG